MPKPQESWPFFLPSLTERVPTELIIRLLTGMSERLQAPVVLLEKNTSQEGRFVCFHNPGSHHKFYQYPRFCRFFQEEVSDGLETCRYNGSFRFLKMLDGNSPSEHTSHCHLGLGPGTGHCRVSYWAVQQVCGLERTAAESCEAPQDIFI